ncbi:MAG: DUF4255 domain-containing protein [Deltaproteobacteria bacterium]|nr:DUF4255 domain-containing protein [Deltaproteobacteria bacterium]
MSKSTVIGDATKTLKELLQNKQLPEFEPQFTVSLKSPKDEKDEISPKINLFLYQVLEDPYAKNLKERALNSGERQRTHLALNLFYLVTPFSSDILNQHQIIGEAMRILYDYAIVDGPLLGGGLEGTFLDIKLALCPLNLEELTRIWYALQTPYRISVCYKARILRIDSSDIRKTGRVIKKELQFSNKEEAGA